MNIKRLAVLFSGNGSNLENLIKTLHNEIFFDFKIEISIAITNNPTALGIKKAQNLGINVVILDHREFKNREEFDLKLVEVVENYSIDLVVLAGFMRILTPIFVNKFDIVNIHPSILPLFKGANGLKESFYSNMKVAGVTIHKVSLELDSGEILAQQCLQKIAGESFCEFENRVHELEHKMYPKAIVEYLAKRI